MHLKQIRSLAGLSQYSVSVGTGIGRSRLSSIENAYLCARADEVQQIERFVADAEYQRAARLNRVPLVSQPEANKRGLASAGMKLAKPEGPDREGPEHD